MSKKLSNVIAFLGHYKYLITIVIGVAFIGFIDENSFLQRIKYDMKISELKDQIEEYDAKNESANAQLRDMRHSVKAIEKIARERYFMKTEDEDVFMLSTDKKPDEGQEKPLVENEAIE